MKKILNAAVWGIVLAAVSASALSVPAQEVAITGSPVSLNVLSSPEKSNEAQVMEVETFQILAQTGDDLMLIRIGNEEGYVNKDELQSVLPQLDCDSFPNLETVKAVAPGSPADEVTALQTALEALGLLTGGVDGLFGPGTAGSVSRFQELHGLEATGTADVNTMLALEAAAAGIEDTLVISNEHFDSVEDKFAGIIGKTDADLTPFMDNAWAFVYDAFEEKGIIDPSLDLGMFVVNEPEVDQIAGELYMNVRIVKDPELDMVTLIPAITVVSEGAYRPYLKELVLAGEKTIHLEGAVSSGTIKGILLEEDGYVPLTKEAMELFGSGGVKSVRVVGRNTEYDVDVEYDAQKMAAFMEACETLG